MGTVTIGVDIGQRVDPTAIAVVEAEDRAPAPTPERLIVRGQGSTTTIAHQPATRPQPAYHFLVRHLERLPLGTPYPAVAQRIAAVAASVRTIISPTASAPAIFLDATGVGQPVVDLVRATGVRVTGVYFTHGDRRTVEADRVTLGKAYLVSRLQALLQTERLKLPVTEETAVLGRELADYEIKVCEDGDDKYGAFKVGTHDDLVTALGLDVVYQEPRQYAVQFWRGLGGPPSAARPSRG